MSGVSLFGSWLLPLLLLLLLLLDIVASSASTKLAATAAVEVDSASLPAATSAVALMLVTAGGVAGDARVSTFKTSVAPIWEDT
jgi:hypothetical protein